MKSFLPARNPLARFPLTGGEEERSLLFREIPSFLSLEPSDHNLLPPTLIVPAKKYNPDRKKRCPLLSLPLPPPPPPLPISPLLPFPMVLLCRRCGGRGRFGSPPNNLDATARKVILVRSVEQPLIFPLPPSLYYRPSFTINPTILSLLRSSAKGTRPLSVPFPSPLRKRPRKVIFFYFSSQKYWGTFRTAFERE